MPSKAGHIVLLVVHWGIIINFVSEILYASHMIFNVIAPPGGGPLFEQATSFPFEMMMTRRLYAVECWLAIAGLSIYLALTEIGPRLRRHRESEAAQ
tara:strand:+ start:224 stop:514 length:291 start_codon:yes stop_codon:yes gene_type:complete